MLINGLQSIWFILIGSRHTFVNIYFVVAQTTDTTSLPTDKHVVKEMLTKKSQFSQLRDMAIDALVPGITILPCWFDIKYKHIIKANIFSCGWFSDVKYVMWCWADIGPTLDWSVDPTRTVKYRLLHLYAFNVHECKGSTADKLFDYWAHLSPICKRHSSKHFREFQ